MCIQQYLILHGFLEVILQVMSYSHAVKCHEINYISLPYDETIVDLCFGRHELSLWSK